MFHAVLKNLQSETKLASALLLLTEAAFEKCFSHLAALADQLLCSCYIASQPYNTKQQVTNAQVKPGYIRFEDRMEVYVSNTWKLAAPSFKWSIFYSAYPVFGLQAFTSFNMLTSL